MKNTLIVIVGPTGVGKTALCLELSEIFKAPIISADSRQFYGDLRIGTAAPTDEEMRLAMHSFVGFLDLEDYYSASQFETDVMKLLTESIFLEKQAALLCGGSMLYVDAVCNGIDDIPTIDDVLRRDLKELYQQKGIEPILRQLKLLDPAYYNQVDLKNHKRVIHALEICIMSGKPYSSLRKNQPKKRPFNILKIGLERDRQELYEFINERVDNMISKGLVDEARAIYDQYGKRVFEINSLNTVGYKELFKHFEGECSLDFAIEKIKQHTRIYSRKQISWFKRDQSITWFHADDYEFITQFISDETGIEVDMFKLFPDYEF
ncbi:MAG: tRNA (adenosine(37)-N6)-dimethylallyltransferase MiaA [Dysgonamonadaceae bacterium]|jgi:tRNA dimethylallyltransferase|nr:tRNA (adenosine(37)-N6)-dimethylallyltransferase MiaA [Dysgonamonadaceae bacterium]